ncbi:hypothetical protein EV383_4305 [Pseudonocardia sediminis]|uniref:Uncharacterized protein n=1 Tax=Pseudonocardia sediminis TaxID=1397368 RepID=A0A4Q7UZY6_PSEST|nr:DUF6307 family protein [Pseudonocardia sediminis]RZT87385.1 hypothetical protein EV383_4305 [Pseudonocardia sediminis]
MTTVATAPTYVTPYELRLSLVVAELRQSADVPEAAAATLAEKILRALDHIPEKVR